MRWFFFVLESVGIKGEEILPLKFKLYKWLVADQRISQTESQAPGIFQIGFYTTFVSQNNFLSICYMYHVAHCYQEFLNCCYSLREL